MNQLGIDRALLARWPVVKFMHGYFGTCIGGQKRHGFPIAQPCDRRLGPYAYVDVGVWLGYVLAACAERNIDTCPMASIAAYPDTLRTHLPLEPTDVVLFGLALGYADPDAPANLTRTTREPVDGVISFLPS